MSTHELACSAAARLLLCTRFEGINDCAACCYGFGLHDLVMADLHLRLPLVYEVHEDIHEVE